MRVGGNSLKLPPDGDNPFLRDAALAAAHYERELRRRLAVRQTIMGVSLVALWYLNAPIAILTIVGLLFVCGALGGLIVDLAMRNTLRLRYLELFAERVAGRD